MFRIGIVIDGKALLPDDAGVFDIGRASSDRSGDFAFCQRDEIVIRAFESPSPSKQKYSRPRQVEVHPNHLRRPGAEILHTADHIFGSWI